MVQPSNGYYLISKCFLFLSMLACKNSGFIFPKDLVGVYYDELRAILTDRVGRKKK